MKKRRYDIWTIFCPAGESGNWRSGPLRFGRSLDAAELLHSVMEEEKMNQKELALRWA